MRRDTLEFDPITKSRFNFWGAEDQNDFHLETVQDVTDVLETNKAFYRATDEKTRYSEMERVASIPMVIVDDLRRKGIWDDDQALKRWLDDPDNRFMRIRPGRLS